MGLIYSIKQDTTQIIDDMKDVLTNMLKIIISVVTLLQDIEDVILELKDLSDMLHFSVNSVDRAKINERLNQLKLGAENLGQRARKKHSTLDLIGMVIEDGIKLRYNEKTKITEKNLNKITKEPGTN